MGKVQSTCSHEVALVRSLCTDERGCWSALMYPRVAPEWYRKLVRGENSEDVHQQPVPEGSFLLLGHISLAVTDQETAKIYWTAGVGLTEGTKVGEDFNGNAGLSQIHCPQKAAVATEVWPGKLTFWVEDIRACTDSFNMLGRTLDSKLVKEVVHSECGGEYALDMFCPWHSNVFQLAEAPWGLKGKLKALLPETQGRSNVLCLSDVQILLQDRELVSSTGLFYEKILGAKVTRKYAVYNRQAQVDKVVVHLGPGEGLHQTITIQCDQTCSRPSNLGSCCIYVQDESFRLTFARCKHAGILEDSKDWKDAEKSREFWISGIQDPDTKAAVLPLRHLIRSSSHPESSVRQGMSSRDAARGGA
eukprot:TRINITY_DN1371_c0_g1_i1.p1 TRINITY_DN1371_c0_g1~~TRINITY_DN1371_c0_g1_i1.p1  ORF type:complete len:361 (+),score=57.12 TRINITY_DN1371_c0_g1_i1:76-1158(+)